LCGGDRDALAGHHAGPSVGAGQDVPEFIAYAKANPGKVNMGSGGVGATGHMAGELFQLMAASSSLMCRTAARRWR